MTVTRYTLSYYYDNGGVVDELVEDRAGEYMKVSDLKQQLDDLLFNNINEACDIMSFLYKLHEELQ